MRGLHSGDEGSSSSVQNVASIDDLSLQIFSRLRLKPLFRFISSRLKKKRRHFQTLDKHQQSSSSAETVASIDDILLQILSRLQLKPLFRFKSVSKHWNSLISNLKLHPNPAAVGFIIHPTERRRFFACIVPLEKSDDPTFLRKPKRRNVEFKIMHGCNGLLVYSSETPNTNRQYFVLNPTTMQRKMLPEPMHPERVVAMCLAFDPSKSPHYRVVCVTGWRLSHMEYQYDRFQVYSSETGSWRCTSMAGFRGFLNVENGVYWNGALHWIPIEGFISIYFDPDDGDHQIPQVFPTPPNLMDYGYGYFGESCGHLHFVGGVIIGELRVYEMKTDYSEWFVKFRVRLSIRGLMTQFIFDGWRLHCICALVRGAKDEDCFLLLCNRGRITRLNIFSRAFEVLRDLPQQPYLGFRVPLPYFESTCSV